MKAKCNLKNFGRYFLHDLKEALSKSWPITLTMAMYPVLNFLIYAYIGYLQQDPYWLIDTYSISWIYEGIAILYFLFVPITCYGRYTEKTEGAGFILLPSSHTTRFASMAVISVIILPVIFIVIFMTADYMIFLAAPERFANETPLLNKISADLTFFTFDRKLHAMTVNFGFMSGLFIPFMVSSAGLCGAWLYRKGNKHAKTFLTCALSFITLMAILILIAEKTGSARWFIPENVGIMAISWVIFQIFCAICCLGYVYLRTKKIEF